MHGLPLGAEIDLLRRENLPGLVRLAEAHVDLARLFRPRAESDRVAAAALELESALAELHVPRLPAGLLDFHAESLARRVLRRRETARSLRAFLLLQVPFFEALRERAILQHLAADRLHALIPSRREFRVVAIFLR